MNLHVWLYAAFAVYLLVNLTFIPAFIFKKNDLADVIWGPGFLVAGFGGLQASNHLDDSRLLLAFALIALWAFRLAWHIGLRNFSHSAEDARYANWRKEWGKDWVWRSYLQVFILQGLILLVINSPLLWILASPPQALDVLCLLGACTWLFGFFFELVSDEQLRRFKKDKANKGKLMTSGLWAWSRHPNYFGEVVQWWGIFLLALPLPMGWLTIISPIAITFLILKVSGVPMLERLMEKRPGAEEYKRNTSMFFPRPPRGKKA